MPSARLAAAALLLVGGEAAGFALPCLSGLWMVVGFVCLVVCLAAYGWGVRRVGCLALVALGFVLSLRTEADLRRILDANAGLHGARERLVLPVEGEVVCRPRAKKGGWRVEFASHAGPMPLQVVWSVRRRADVPKPGETWAADGWISRKEDRENRYARRTLWVGDPARAARCAETRTDALRAGWETLGTELARRAGIGLGWCAELAGLNRAILLGRRSGLSKARRRIFADAGTIHVFAISGLHVMVVALMITVVLKRFDVPAAVRGLVCIPLVWAYVVLTGARPSAVRAALMATLWLVAPALGRRPDSLAAWSATALVVYALSPERVFDLGCALSFTVMFGIVLWVDWSRHFRPWFEEGSRLRRLAGNFGVSLAAWVAGVPLAAHAFGRFTPGGLLANLAVLWCAGWMVKFGAGGLVATFVCLPLAALLNNVAAGFTWSMATVSEWVAALPFSNFEVEKWSVGACALWYAAWFAALLVAGRLLPRRERVSRRWWT